jgi:Tol biopolymer transport system component
MLSLSPSSTGWAGGGKPCLYSVLKGRRVVGWGLLSHLIVARRGRALAQPRWQKGAGAEDFYGGSWSPTGNKIVFAARTDPDHRLAVWVVDADGRALHQLPITPSCGGAFSDARSISCLDPGWSPDGTKIAFTRATKGTPSSIYTVNADGSSLSQVTNARGDSQPDWGPHPLAG